MFRLHPFAIRLSMLAMLLASSAATLTIGANAADDEDIRLRPEDKDATIAIASTEHVWLKKELTPTDFQQDAANAARTLGEKNLDSGVLSAITDAIGRDPVRAAKAFGECLNPKNCPDPQVRKGAVKGIEISKAKPELVGRVLAAVVIAESNPEVRASAVALIKSRKDPVANRALLAYYQDAFDDSGALIKADHERAALDALKAVGGHMIYEQLMAWATEEIRVGTATEIAPPQTVFITNGGNVNNGVGSINLPIELPNLELRSVNTTIAVPAFGALKLVTGQNFGRRFDHWQNWINKQD